MLEAAIHTTTLCSLFSHISDAQTSPLSDRTRRRARRTKKTEIHLQRFSFFFVSWFRLSSSSQFSRSLIVMVHLSTRRRPRCVCMRIEPVSSVRGAAAVAVAVRHGRSASTRFVFDQPFPPAPLHPSAVVHRCAAVHFVVQRMCEWWREVAHCAGTHSIDRHADSLSPDSSSPLHSHPSASSIQSILRIAVESSLTHSAPRSVHLIDPSTHRRAATAICNRIRTIDPPCRRSPSIPASGLCR